MDGDVACQRCGRVVPFPTTTDAERSWALEAYSRPDGILPRWEVRALCDGCMAEARQVLEAAGFVVVEERDGVAGPWFESEDGLGSWARTTTEDPPVCVADVTVLPDGAHWWAGAGDGVTGVAPTAEAARAAADAALVAAGWTLR